jgi:putative ABC transport system permease protein
MTRRDAPQWRRYLRFWGPSVDADVDDELSFHVESLSADLERRGHSRENARRLARERFGDVVTVERWLKRHDQMALQRRRLGDIMSELLQDLKYGVRKLVANPGFAIAVVCVLALGAGATTAIFSSVDAALVRPLPFPAADRLVALTQIDVPNIQSPGRRVVVGPDDLRDAKDVFASVAVYGTGGLNLTGGTEPARVRIGQVTPDFFATLGVRVSRGRVFTTDEGRPNGARVAVLGDGVWRRQFGADPAIVGKQVKLNEVSYRVIGVMPAGFSFPARTELWVPLQVPTDIFDDEAHNGTFQSTAIARLAPGATLASARARVDALNDRIWPKRPRVGEPAATSVVPLRDDLLNNQQGALHMLMGAALLVLLIACANVMNLLLSRAGVRRREIALRSVLGATRGRILRQLVVETAILAVLGVTGGLVVARLSFALLGTLLPPDLVSVAPLRLDGRVLVFALTLAGTTGLVFGLWPAWVSLRRDAADVLKHAGEFGSTRSGRHVRSVLVVTEIAVALMLFVGAALMLESFKNLTDTDSGLRPEQVMTLELTLPKARYESPGARNAFYAALLSRLGTTPGIRAVSLSNVLPMGEHRGFAVELTPEGVTRPPSDQMDERYLATWVTSSPGYFRALGIPLLRGRALNDRDDSSSTAMVISQGLAERSWPAQDPIGKRMEAMGRLRTVVGIVGDVRMRGLDRPVWGQFYLPLTTTAPAYAVLAARGTLSSTAFTKSLREAVHAIDPQQAVYNVRPMSDVVSGSMSPQRTRTMLIAAFAALALVLSAVGVYSVLAHDVVQRTREIGIRMALGARSRDVRWMILGHGAILSVVGIGVGVVGSYALTRLMATLLFGVSPTDPRVFAGASITLFSIASMATYLPARRSTGVDPIIALRAE